MRRTMIAKSLIAMSLTAMLPLLLCAAPASAATQEQKLETCTFGADDAKLTGAKRKTFMARCMANRDDKRGPAQKPAADKK